MADILDFSSRVGLTKGGDVDKQSFLANGSQLGDRIKN